MKQLKQRAIPKGTVEMVMRGSKHEIGNLSVRVILPSHVAGQILSYAMPQASKKKRQIKS